MARNSFVNLSASGQVFAGAGTLSGMYVNSTSSGTVKLVNSLTGTATPIVFNTITPAIGYHNLGNVECSVGCYAIISNTLDVTFFVRSVD